MFDHIFDVEMKMWYGWVLVKRFKADAKLDVLHDAFEIKYAQECAQELLEKLEDEL